MYTVHLFPGQGDFAVGALLRGAAEGRILRRTLTEVFREVDEVAADLGIPPVGARLLGGSPPSTGELARALPGTLQLAAYGSSLAVHRALAERRGSAPDAVLGVSFGEIAALAAAGVLTVADGAVAAHALARVLTGCPGGLVLLACGEDRALGLLDAAHADRTVIACVNDATETLVSGPVEELARVEEHAAGVHVRATRLRLPFSSHHPQLKSQADEFAEAVRILPVGRAAFPVYSAVAGRAYTAEDEPARVLADCLVHPVHLPRVLRILRLRAPGRRLYCHEAGTGCALARNAARVLSAEGGRATVTAPLASVDGHPPGGLV
ncbi:acyltransferase domain-containing protein [Streptomyces sp. NPDC097619]|uniref:ACP S-malonyltransferase n=1 Tax=Streptomyces sp. NPDC097619 TaxID=3157228 RepID=UPI00332368B7